MCIRDRYRGTADALYQNLDFLKKSHEPYVVLASGDGIYKLDYNKAVSYTHLDVYKRQVLANRTHPECRARAYGAAVLNWPLGGLNPMAAASALRMGAKILFMPTRDAANCLLYGDMPGDFFKRQGISVLDPSGRLRPEIYEIFDLVKEYGALLATGHISTKAVSYTHLDVYKRQPRLPPTRPLQ